MIIWINGAFGSGKTSAAFELNRRLSNSFVYDPENAGFFIRRNIPDELSKGDFQDIVLWREINYKLISFIAHSSSKTLIIPMTVVNPDYYKEIIGKLISEGQDVKHFILYANKNTLLHRLRLRRFFGGDKFAVDSIDRCLYSFDNLITETKIYTDNMRIYEVVNEIANQCGITLMPDKSSHFKKIIYKVLVFLKHIRFSCNTL